MCEREHAWPDDCEAVTVSSSPCDATQRRPLYANGLTAPAAASPVQDATKALNDDSIQAVRQRGRVGGIALAAIASASVTVAAAVIGFGTSHLGIESQNARVSTATALFLICAVLLLAAQSEISRLMLRPEIRGGVLRRCVLIAAAYSLVGACLSGSLEMAWSETGVVVLLVAAAEEAVFRWMLPLRAWRLMAGSTTSQRWRWYLGIAFSQFAFALSHALSGAYPHPFSDTMRLVAAGVLYSVVALTAGLGVSTLVHASLNLALFAPTARALEPSLGTVVLALGFGILAIRRLPIGYKGVAELPWLRLSSK